LPDNDVPKLELGNEGGKCSFYGVGCALRTISTGWGDGTMIKYEVIIYWSEEDQAFIAEVPELPGCAAAGETYREALANVEVVIQGMAGNRAGIGPSHSSTQGPAHVCLKP